ncbi:sortase domain-bontaining protein [[Actinomadura] parvosata]|uniref:sortase domain-containing protein n=1 Tax=[Actinomadura] parvosata TaxID=1955412 RepID=UPI0009ADD70C|nr:class F sortase [Nonomuraea sp. ATCC 55076]
MPASPDAREPARAGRCGGRVDRRGAADRARRQRSARRRRGSGPDGRPAVPGPRRLAQGPARRARVQGGRADARRPPHRRLHPVHRRRRPPHGAGPGRGRSHPEPALHPPNLAGWYRYGPVPGQRGAAVITGHLDTRTGPAVFARLKEVKRGAQVQVLRADRSVAVFVVDKVEHAPKRGFPAKKVYAKLRYPGLRLVTCGGAFDRQAHSYEENTIVYAHLAAPYYPGR